MHPICSTTFLHVILTPGSGQAVQTRDSASGASERKSFPSTGEGTTLFEGREWIGWKAELTVRLREQIQSLASWACCSLTGHMLLNSVCQRHEGRVNNWHKQMDRTLVLFCIHKIDIGNWNSETQQSISCPKPVLLLIFPIHIKLLKLTEHDPYWLCNILLSNYNFQPRYRMYWIQV